MVKFLKLLTHFDYCGIIEIQVGSVLVDFVEITHPLIYILNELWYTVSALIYKSTPYKIGVIF